MIDIKLVRETPKIIIDDLQKRGDSDRLKLLEELAEKDKNWRLLNIEIDKLKNQRNVLSKEIGQAKAQGKSPEALLAKAADIPKLIEVKEREMKEMKERSQWILMRLPNILHKSVSHF